MEENTDIEIAEEPERDDTEIGEVEDTAKTETAETDIGTEEREISEGLNKELLEIGKLDSDVKELKDIVNSETYPKVLELVEKGYSLLDSYKLANMDRFIRQAAAKAARRAMNQISSKSHLVKAEIKGEAENAVPFDVMNEYRSLVPEASDAEIRKHYSKYINH